MMIEVVYKEEKKKAVGNEEYFHIPRNIRQIGEVDDDFKIYIEDYAYHYLDRIAEGDSGGKIALLLGQTNWADGIAYVFVKSALELSGAEADANHIVLDEEIWSRADRIMEKSFPEQDVVGWFFSLPECSMELTDAMYRTHVSQFAGNQRIFFLKEPTDQEEALFRYDDGKLCRVSGYYLYYERNDAMQNFLIEKNENKPMESSSDVTDKAVKDFRDKTARRKEAAAKTGKERSGSLFMYATGAAALLLALALGTSYFNDYQALRSTQGRVDQVISSVRGEEETPAPTAKTAARSTASTQSAGTTQPTETAQPAGTERPASTAQPTGTVKPSSPPQPAAAEQSAEETSEKKPEEAAPTAAAQPAPEESAESASRPEVYRIRSGDTLTSISRAVYGDIGMIGEICRYNGISEDTVIYAGETILLP